MDKIFSTYTPKAIFGGLGASLTIIFCSFIAPEWGINIDKAKTEATASQKYIVLNFSGSDWCGPCIKLKKDIFESQDFIDYASKKLVLVRADFPRLKKNRLSKEQTAHNESLAEQYNKEGKFPMTVLLDASGKVIKKWDGYVQKSGLDFANEIDALTGAAK